MITDLPRLMAPINDLIAPGIRLGAGNPLPLTSGLVVLEVVGRSSGEIRSVPLLCTDYGQALVVSTVRPGSQWLKNLAAAGEASVWLRGRRRKVTAFVYRRGERLGAAAPGQPWASFARAVSRLLGTSIAVLVLGS